MTRTLLRLLMLGLLPAGCGGRQTPQHEAAPAAEPPAIRATAAAAEEPDSCGDTLRCELPQCALLRTDTLLDPADTLLGMRTERTQYPADVRTICALVVNPTDTPLYFGRAWSLLRHEAEGWRRVPGPDPRLRMGGGRLPDRPGAAALPLPLSRRSALRPDAGTLPARQALRTPGTMARTDGRFHRDGGSASRACGRHERRRPLRTAMTRNNLKPNIA